MSDSASPYVIGLLRQGAQTPAILAIYTARPTVAFHAGDLALVLLADAGFVSAWAPWLARAGEAALIETAGLQGRVITLDGATVEIRVAFSPEAAALEGATEVFRRSTVAPTQGSAQAESAPDAADDLGRSIGSFWGDLYLALAAIGSGWPLAAHGALELCSVRLLDLYRLALAPGSTSRGWFGLDALQAGGVLDSMRPWLVAPLVLHEQWRCAHRLAAAYESLVLPLAQRLGVPYPWTMRNLAFARLDAVRPDKRTGSGSPELSALGGQPRPDLPVPTNPTPKPSPPRGRKIRFRRPGTET